MVVREKMRMFSAGNRRKESLSPDFRFRIASQVRTFEFAIRNPQSAAGSRGFTLIELLVVLVLIAMISAVMIPSLGRGLSTVKLKTSSREIAAALRLARSKAVREQQVYFIGFDLEKNQVELTSETLKYQRSFSLPEGVSIKEVSFLNAEQGKNRSSSYFFFSPNGMADAFEVTLRNERGRESKVIQDSVRPEPRIEEVENVKTF